MKIYGFHNSKDPRKDGVAYAIAETGEVVASHFCSNQIFARHDLGMDGTCDWKHDIYDKRFPDGWSTEFIAGEDVDTHEGLQRALELNGKMAEEATTTEGE